MGLGLTKSGDGGDWLKYVKFNAKEGKWQIKNDDGEDIWLEKKFKAAFDFDNIKTGEIKFGSGVPPQYAFDTEVGAGDAVAPEGYKRGFLVHVFSKSLGVREMSSNSMHVCNQISAVYDEWETEKSKNAGKVAVVECTEIRDKADSNNNHAPVLKIVSWMDRPAEFDDVGGGNTTPPPPPAAVEEDDDDF